MTQRASFSLLFALVFVLAACTLPPPPPGPDVPHFEDVSETAGVTAVHRGSWNEFTNRPFEDGYQAMGQAWGDYDADGWPDLYVTGNLAPSALYHNNRDGTFSVSPFSESVSLPDTVSGGAVWADYDNDGWADLYVLAHGANVLFRNLGREGFVDVTDAAGVGDPAKGITATWGDYDADGFLDLYVANWACYPKCDPVDFEQSQDRLYHNNGDGTFTDVSESLVHAKLLGAAFSASFVDYDNDGDSDLYVINDKLLNPIGNVLWRNDGPGCGHWCWTDVSADAGADAVVHGMGLATADYDNDGDLDFFFTNMVEPSWLLQNQGDGSFAPADAEVGLPQEPSDQVGWGTGFFDYDNDGWMDLFVATTGFVKLSPMEGPIGMMLPYPNFLYRNNGDGTFRDVTPPAWKFQPVATMGFAAADYDRDGHVDFVQGDWNEGYRLYRNRGLSGAGNNWIRFRLVGGADVNRDAVGARAYVTTDDGRTQMQEVITGGSLGAGNDTALHFGLGRAQVVNVSVRWPNGVEQELGPLAPGREWTIEYTPSK